MSGSGGEPIVVKIAAERLHAKQIDWVSANQVLHFGDQRGCYPQ